MNYTKLEHIAHLADTAFSAFLQKHKKELGGRKGLYLLIVDRFEWKTLGIRLGSFENEKALLEKTLFATEKACRLEQHYKDHTSFKTQDQKQKKYGGGIGTKEIIIAGSGFPAKYDHLFCLETLTKADIVTPKEIDLIQKEFERYQYRGIS